MSQLLEEVFVTEGLPQFTFVRPPNFQESSSIFGIRESP